MASHDWIGRFQDSALNPALWLDVLQELADATGSSRAELVGFGAESFGQFNWVTSSDEGMLQDFLAAGGTSPSMNYRIAADDGRSILAVADETNYDRTRLAVQGDGYLDFCEQYQMVHGCQTVLAREAGGLIGFSLLRSRSDGRTGEAERRTFAAAAAAARTAVRMQQAVERQGHHLLHGTIEAMSIPCLLLDGFGEVHAVTAEAEDLIARTAVLSVRQRRVSVSDPRLARQLDLALREVLSPSSESNARLFSGEGAIPDIILDLFALPRREWSLPYEPRVLLVLRDPMAINPHTTAILRASFGLTAAEAEIARSMGSGLSREQVAAQRGVSSETLRTQLRNVYSKTGCSRESELVLLIKALAP